MYADILADAGRRMDQRRHQLDLPSDAELETEFSKVANQRPEPSWLALQGRVLALASSKVVQALQAAVQADGEASTAWLYAMAKYLAAMKVTPDDPDLIQSTLIEVRSIRWKAMEADEELIRTIREQLEVDLPPTSGGTRLSAFLETVPFQADTSSQ